MGKTMLLLSQSPAIAGFSCRRSSQTARLTPTSSSSFLPFGRLISPSRGNRRLNFVSSSAADDARETASSAGGSRQTTSASPPPSRSFPGGGEIVSVGEEGVPLEGVIQFDRPSPTSRLESWGRVSLLAGGDVLFLLVFSAIGRFSHGLPVFDVETFRTADPFMAGWFLGAYFLGGYGDDGKGVNGRGNAVTAAAKSWAAGIPTGILIRAVTHGHPPPINFVLVTMGATGVLLIGWRALLYTLFPNKPKNNNDMYKRGSPFELFELLMSLVRRW